MSRGSSMGSSKMRICSGRRLPLWRAPRECTIVHRRTMVFNKRENAAGCTRVPISRALQ